ncbi:hypothetical protein Hanom_Chr15g01370421 [Helianthus anomalus]
MGLCLWSLHRWVIEFHINKTFVFVCSWCLIVSRILLFIFCILFQLIEEEEVEVPVSNESSNMDMDKAPAEVASTNENDVNMQDASVTENDVVETGDTPVQMETDTKVEAPKKKVKKPTCQFPNLSMGQCYLQTCRKQWKRSLKWRCKTGL